MPLAKHAAATSPPIITRRHIDQLVLHTARHSRCKQRDIALFLMLVHTGARPNEIARMAIADDIDASGQHSVKCLAACSPAASSPFGHQTGTMPSSAAASSATCWQSLSKNSTRTPALRKIYMTSRAAQRCSEAISMASFRYRSIQLTLRPRPSQKALRNSVLSSLPAPDIGSDGTSARLRGHL